MSNLFIIIIVYTIAASSESWLVNWLKLLYSIELPIFVTIILSSSWPIQLIQYLIANQNYLKENGEKRIITPIMARNYIILGLLASFVSITKVSGLTTLPVVIYSIASNTEIVFETIMTVIVLKRTVSYLQIISVILVCMGVIISVYNPVSKMWGDNETVTKRELIIGLILTISSRFASSLNSILADKFLKIDSRSYMGCLECAVANSMIPFFILPTILIFIPEYNSWNELRGTASGTCIITLILIALSITKYADRLSKFFILSSTSTMYFAAIDSNMKVVSGIGAFFFFGEIYYWPQILGFILIIVALIIMYYDRMITSDQHQKYTPIPNNDDNEKDIYMKE